MKTPYQYFENKGVQIAYRVFQPAQATSNLILFVLNGGPGRSSDSFTPLAEKLSALNQTVVLFDQRGSGRSKLQTLDESTVTLDLMVTDLEALRIHLGQDQISILGHSFGGMYGMAYAVQHPHRLKSLILSASGGVDLSWREYSWHNILSRLSPQARADYVFWTSPEQIAKDQARAGLEAIRIIVPAYIYDQKFVPQIERDLTNPAYFTPALNQFVWKSMESYDLRLGLKKFLSPTLILAGRQDILGEAVPLAISQTIPNSQLEFLNQCGHYPWLDAPDKYFSLIQNFLNSNQ